jgi:hypothetical protein
VSALAVVLTLGTALLASPPAHATIQAPPAAGGNVSGIVTITENEFPPTVTPNTTKCTTATRNKTGQVNLTIYRGPTSAAPAWPYRPTQSVVVANPPAPVAPYSWNTFRWPNGTYNLRTSINDRTVPATPATNANCALGATVVKSDPYNVNLANPGAIDQVSGEGTSGADGTATVTARLVDNSIVPAAPYVTNSAPPIQIMRTKGYSLLGGLIVFTVGNGGTPPGSTVDGVSFPNGVAPTTFPTSATPFTLYTDTVEGYAPGIADGETQQRFQRLTVTTDEGPRTVECTTTFKNTTSPSLTGADKFNGFGNCFGSGTGKMIAPQQQPDGSYTGGSTVVEGHDPAKLTFHVGGFDSEAVSVDRVTGLATATFATPNIPAGRGVPVTVTSSDDGFLTPATKLGAIDYKGGSITAYTGDTEAFWDEDYSASATVESAIGHVPVDEGTVTFTRGTQVVEDVPVHGGVAGPVTLHAVDDPSANQTINAHFSGTEVFNGSDDSPAFTTKPRPTHVVYTGATTGRYGSPATFSATLTDVRNGDALPDQAIAFKLGDADAVSATTDEDGNASTTVPVNSKVGTYDLVTSFFSVARYEGDTATVPFRVGFQYEFTDTLIGNGGTTQLNPDTQQASYRTKAGAQSRIADDSFQLSLYLPTVIGYPGTGPLPELPDTWSILNLPRLTDLFALLANPPAVTPPTVNPPTAPEVPTVPPDLSTLPVDLSALPVDPSTLPIPLPMAPASANRAGTSATNGPGGVPLPPAGGGLLLPTEGMTLGEFIARIQAAGIPTSLSACELITGSTCERRFIIAASLNQKGPWVVGAFDVVSGLFADLVAKTKSSTTDVVVGASLGSCATPQPLCIAVPGAPGGPPTLPSPDTLGLEAAIAALIAQLQSIPDQISAPPVPPTPEVPSTMSTAAPPSAPTALPTISLLPGRGMSLARLIPTYWLG